jgi:intracellular sulfur oxidation DsrE/DsrF family protein
MEVVDRSINPSNCLGGLDHSKLAGLLCCQPRRTEETMKAFVAMLAALNALALAGCATTGGGGAVAPDKVVYHFSDGLEQASNGLRNINNHVEVNPQANIVVVSHARGVDFLMRDARDKNGNPYEVIVQDLKARGVTFEVCEITLRNRKLTKKQFIEEAAFVPSGVAEIAKKQQREGYAYLKP